MYREGLFFSCCKFN